jgi:hypothetical protein
VTATPTATDPLDGLAPDDVPLRWADRGLDQLSDGELVELAATHLSAPRRDPADSFVLHAPLELLARSALLPLVEPAARDAARQRIAWVVASYDRGAPASFPAPSADTAVPDLSTAIAAGDLDGIDQAAIAAAATTTAAELVARLTDVVLPSLAAAAHGAIFLYHLPRLAGASPAAATMARGLLRELGRAPDWTLTWMDDRPAIGTPTGDLAARLLAPIDAGDPGSNFIYPTMHLVERVGLAADLLDAPTRGLAVAAARRDLLRVAAWSMLQDDPAHAPYGWSHCLTMPHATLGVAAAATRPDRAVAVAATYVLGFRSTLGTVTLDPAWAPEPAGALDVDTFIAAGPRAAAAAVGHADDATYGAMVRRLATNAACHHDAHLAKYTLACIDASRDDPGAGRLYLAAAAHLAGVWSTRDVAAP